MGYESPQSVLWRYYCFSKQWGKVSVRGMNDMVIDHAALTSNEDQVILFGARHGGPRQLFILDIRRQHRYQLMESNILCGNLEPVALLRTGHGVKDELLVIGWIRELFA